MKYCKLAVLLLLLSACRETIRNTAPTAATDTGTAGPADPKPADNGSSLVRSEADLPGYWVGMFVPADSSEKFIEAGEGLYWQYENKINLSVDSLGGGRVFGHSVVAGNLRPFTGTVRKTDSAFVFEAAEPGDDKYDGRFSFSIPINDSVLKGTWLANGKIETPKRRYRLAKKTFRYDPDRMPDGYQPYVDWLKTKPNPDYYPEFGEYELAYFTTTDKARTINASKEKLSRETVANLSKGDLFVIRNAIYARHGYSFKQRQLRVFFDQMDWYIPVRVNVKDELTEIEKANIELLLKYEKHAREYYDEFGRG